MNVASDRGVNLRRRMRNHILDPTWRAQECRCCPARCGQEPPGRERTTMATHGGRRELAWMDRGAALLTTRDGKYDSTFVDLTSCRICEARLPHWVERARLRHTVERIEAATPVDAWSASPVRGRAASG